MTSLSSSATEGWTWYLSLLGIVRVRFMGEGSDPNPRREKLGWRDEAKLNPYRYGSPWGYRSLVFG